MSAFLIVAAFRNSKGTLDDPEIWVGATAYDIDELISYWQENLDNFEKGQDPVVSHILEVFRDGKTKIIPWNSGE